MSPVNESSVIPTSASNNRCAVLIAMVQAIGVLRADLQYRVDSETGLLADEFADDIAKSSRALYGVATKVGAVYNLTLPTTFDSMAQLTGRIVAFKVPEANSGPSSLKIGTLTETSIVRDGAIPLSGNELPANKVALVLYDGAQFHLLNPNPASAASLVKVTNPVEIPTYGNTVSIARPDQGQLIRGALVCQDDDAGWAADEEIDASGVMIVSADSSRESAFTITTGDGYWFVSTRGNRNVGSPNFEVASRAANATQAVAINRSKWRLKLYYL